MNSERLGDGAHLPVLSIKVAADLYRIQNRSSLLTCENLCAEKDRRSGRAAADHAAYPKYSPLTRPNTQRSNRRIVTAFPPSDGERDAQIGNLDPSATRNGGNDRRSGSHIQPPFGALADDGDWRPMPAGAAPDRGTPRRSSAGAITARAIQKSDRT